MAAPADELADVEGLGTIIAEAIATWFSLQPNNGPSSRSCAPPASTSACRCRASRRRRRCWPASRSSCPARSTATPARRPRRRSSPAAARARAASARRRSPSSLGADPGRQQGRQGREGRRAGHRGGRLRPAPRDRRTARSLIRGVASAARVSGRPPGGTTAALRVPFNASDGETRSRRVAGADRPRQALGGSSTASCSCHPVGGSPASHHHQRRSPASSPSSSSGSGQSSSDVARARRPSTRRRTGRAPRRAGARARRRSRPAHASQARASAGVQRRPARLAARRARGRRRPRTLDGDDLGPPVRRGRPRLDELAHGELDGVVVEPRRRGHGRRARRRTRSAPAGRDLAAVVGVRRQQVGRLPRRARTGRSRTSGAGHRGGVDPLAAQRPLVGDEAGRAARARAVAPARPTCGAAATTSVSGPIVNRPRPRRARRRPTGRRQQRQPVLGQRRRRPQLATGADGVPGLVAQPPQPRPSRGSRSSRRPGAPARRGRRGGSARRAPRRSSAGVVRRRLAQTSGHG